MGTPGQCDGKYRGYTCKIPRTKERGDQEKTGGTGKNYRKPEKEGGRN